MNQRDKDRLQVQAGVLLLITSSVTFYLTCLLATHETVTKGYSFMDLDGSGFGFILWAIPIVLFVVGLGLLISLAAPFDGRVEEGKVAELTGGPEDTKVSQP